MANTAWSVVTTKNNGDVTWQSVVDIAASSATYYTNEISFMGPDLSNNNRWVAVHVSMAAVTSTHVEVALYGVTVTGGTKFALKTTLVANLTTGAVLNAGGVVDLNAYPAAYYYVGLTTDADDAANDATVSIFVPGAAI